VPQADQASHRVVLDGPATGQLVSESVRKGVGLFAAEVRAEPGFRLTTDQRVTPGTLHIGCVISGQGTFASPGKQQDPQHWRGAGTIMTMVPADDRLVYHVEIDQPMSGLGINVEPEALAAMFGSDELPPSLRDIFEGKITPVATVTKARFDPARIANDLLRPDFAGSLMSLYREAKSLEFLTHLLGSLESAMPAGPVDLSKRVLTKVEEARDRLVSDLRNPPGLHDLAGAVGLTAKVLNQGFRTLYGTTVFDYLRDTRLTAARRMIEDGLEMPLKQIAWQVGYGQASNFVSAYRRHFGAPPRRLNRQRSLAQ
jgi:AraC-like DNA-binding protein